MRKTLAVVQNPIEHVEDFEHLCALLWLQRRGVDVQHLFVDLFLVEVIVGRLELLTGLEPVELFVGMAVEEIAGIPVDFSVKIIPKTKFAVFTLSGELIEKDLSAEMREWLAAEGLSQTGNFIFNLYDERYKGMDNLKDSEIEVYVPIA